MCRCCAFRTFVTTKVGHRLFVRPKRSIWMGDHVIADEQRVSSSCDRDHLTSVKPPLSAFAHKRHDAEIVAMATRRVGARRSAGGEGDALVPAGTTSVVSVPVGDLSQSHTTEFGS